MWRSPCSSLSTRSASVMMPTQRPPLLITGTPGSSWRRMTRTTLSTSSSGRTATGSRSMMSATVRAMRSAHLTRSPGVRQGLDDVARDDAVDAALAGGAHAGAGVQAHAGAGGGERLDAPGQHRGEDAAEDVTGAGGGQRGGGAGADGHGAIRPRHQRVVALEHDDRLRLAGGGAGVVQAAGLDRRAVDAEQAAQLALVGGEDRGGPAGGPRGPVAGG